MYELVYIAMVGDQLHFSVCHQEAYGICLVTTSGPNTRMF